MYSRIKAESRPLAQLISYELPAGSRHFPGNNAFYTLVSKKYCRLPGGSRYTDNRCGHAAGCLVHYSSTAYQPP